MWNDILATTYNDRFIWIDHRLSLIFIVCRAFVIYLLVLLRVGTAFGIHLQRVIAIVCIKFNCIQCYCIILLWCRKAIQHKIQQKRTNHQPKKEICGKTESDRKRKKNNKEPEQLVWKSVEFQISCLFIYLLVWNRARIQKKKYVIAEPFPSNCATIQFTK